MEEYDIATLKDLIRVIIGTIIFLAAFIAVAAWINYVVGERGCYARWGDFEAEWSYWAGCRVEIDGKLVPEDRIRKDRP